MLFGCDVSYHRTLNIRNILLELFRRWRCTSLIMLHYPTFKIMFLDGNSYQFEPVFLF